MRLGRSCQQESSSAGLGWSQEVALKQMDGPRASYLKQARPGSCRQMRLLPVAAAVGFFAIVWWSGAEAQTRVDLAKQAKNVDFSQAATTKPFRSGTELPGTCTTGETFFKTDAVRGKQLHLCVGPNTWVPAGEELPTLEGAEGKFLANAGGEVRWQELGGDLSGPAGSVKVMGIQGRPVSPATPSDRNVLVWSEATGRWEPQEGGVYEAGSGVTLAGRLINVDDAVVPNYYRGSGAPVLDCAAGRDYYLDETGGVLYFCASDGVWRALSTTGHEHAASDIQTGMLGLARGGTNQASWTAGRCVQVSADGTRLESASGACATANFDPLDQSTMWFREEFGSGGSSGELGWSVYGTGCTANSSISVGSYGRKVVQVQTSTTSGNECQYYVGGGQQNGVGTVGKIAQYGGWSTVFRFKFDDTTNVTYRVGLWVWATSRLLGIAYDTSAGHTQFMYQYDQSYQTTGVAVDTNPHTIKMWSNMAGTIYMQFDSLTPISVTSSSTYGWQPVFIVKTNEAANKRLMAIRWMWSGPYVE